MAYRPPPITANANANANASDSSDDSSSDSSDEGFETLQLVQNAAIARLSSTQSSSKRSSRVIFQCPVCSSQLEEDEIIAHVDRCADDLPEDLTTPASAPAPKRDGAAVPYVTVKASTGATAPTPSASQRPPPKLPAKSAPSAPIAVKSPPASKTSQTASSASSPPSALSGRAFGASSPPSKVAANGDANAGGHPPESVLPEVSKLRIENYATAERVKVIHAWIPFDFDTQHQLVVGDVIEVVRRRPPPPERTVPLTIGGDPATLWMWKGGLFDQVNSFPVAYTVPTRDPAIRKSMALRPDEMLRVRKTGDLSKVDPKTAAEAPAPAPALAASPPPTASSGKGKKPKKEKKVKVKKEKKLKGKAAEIARLQRLGLRKQYGTMHVPVRMETEDLVSSIASLQRQVDMGKSQLDALSSKDRASPRGQRLQSTIDDCEGNARLLLRELTKRATVNQDPVAAQALAAGDGRVVSYSRTSSERASASDGIPDSLKELFTMPEPTEKPGAGHDGLIDALGTLDEMDAALIAAASDASETTAKTTAVMPPVQAAATVATKLFVASVVAKPVAASLPATGAPKPVAASLAASGPTKTVPTAKQVLSAIQHVLKRSEFSMKQLFSECEALGINADACDSKDMLVDVLWEYAHVACKEITLRSLVEVCDALAVPGADTFEKRDEYIDSLEQMVASSLMS